MVWCHVCCLLTGVIVRLKSPAQSAIPRAGGSLQTMFDFFRPSGPECCIWLYRPLHSAERLHWRLMRLWLSLWLIIGDCYGTSYDWSSLFFALNWMATFCSGYRLFWEIVYYDGSKSAMTTRLCGVPQGSFLGPILYVLCTAEIFSAITACGMNVHSYADDIQLYAGGSASTAVELWLGSPPAQSRLTTEVERRQDTGDVVGHKAETRYNLCRSDTSVVCWDPHLTCGFDLGVRVW